METEIGAGKFKAHCLELLDTVNRTRAPLVITKRGKPVARLVPYEEKPVALYGAMKGSVTFHGDIVSPDFDAWKLND